MDILAFGIHPDDVELSCSGTLLRHISMGYSVGLCDLSEGELGTRGTNEIRLKEAEAARQKMGAIFRENLGMRDGFFSVDEKHILSVVRIIRKYRPEIILANAVTDRHPDHGRAADLIAQASFYSGLQKIQTYDFAGNSQSVWRPKALYHYIQDRNLPADFVVDISQFIEQKMELIQTFESQFYNPDSTEPQTPISSASFLEFIKAKNRSYGRDAGFEYAEAFNVKRNIGVTDLFHLQ